MWLLFVKPTQGQKDYYAHSKCKNYGPGECGTVYRAPVNNHGAVPGAKYQEHIGRYRIQNAVNTWSAITGEE